MQPTTAASRSRGGRTGGWAVEGSGLADPVGEAAPVNEPLLMSYLRWCGAFLSFGSPG